MEDVSSVGTGRLFLANAPVMGMCQRLSAGLVKSSLQAHLAPPLTRSCSFALCLGTKTAHPSPSPIPSRALAETGVFPTQPVRLLPQPWESCGLGIS